MNIKSFVHRQIGADRYTEDPGELFQGTIVACNNYKILQDSICLNNPCLDGHYVIKLFYVQFIKKL